MTISVKDTAFVVSGESSLSLSSMITMTAATNPAYIVVTALDRDEYTAGSSDDTGSFSGNGHTLDFKAVSGDERAAGIVFTYQGGQYVNSTYGNLNQLVYNASGSTNDVTNISLYSTASASVASANASNPFAMIQADSAGYLGSVTVATQPSFSSGVPSQATPGSIASIAESFVGKPWNLDGCWVLASTIASEAGAGLPVVSSLVGTAGQANGEWFVAYNGPASASASWQSKVTAGEMIVIGTPSSGHITTCVSGSGSTAMVVDNAVFYSGNTITNPANDGSSNDIIISAPHSASSEFAGVAANMAVIYELDCPIVTDLATSTMLNASASMALSKLFSAADPHGKTVTSYQIYESNGSDAIKVGSTTESATSAGSAATVASLSSVTLTGGTTNGMDTIDVRAFNGSYWGDWQTASVDVIGGTSPNGSPTVTGSMAIQTWVAGHSIAFSIPGGTFSDPSNEHLTYTASLVGGTALPTWLKFNAATDSFTGVAPAVAQTLHLAVTAIDSSGLSTTDDITANVVVYKAPTMLAATPTQNWAAGDNISFTIPSNEFTDHNNETLVYAATLSNGQALPSWLSFNAATDSFSGTAPANTTETLALKVTASDASGLSVADSFTAHVINYVAPTASAQTATQNWTTGQNVSLAIPGNEFVDHNGDALSYTATEADGSALPSWLKFNTATHVFSGTAPATAETLSVVVTATDTISHLSATDTFSINIAAHSNGSSHVTGGIELMGVTTGHEFL